MKREIFERPDQDDDGGVDKPQICGAFGRTAPYFRLFEEDRAERYYSLRFIHLSYIFKTPFKPIADIPTASLCDPTVLSVIYAEGNHLTYLETILQHKPRLEQLRLISNDTDTQYAQDTRSYCGIPNLFLGGCRPPYSTHFPLKICSRYQHIRSSNLTPSFWSASWLVGEGKVWLDSQCEVGPGAGEVV